MRVGKIARLPMEIREELNKRLLNGQPGTTIIPWLNSLPEVKVVLAEYFAGQEVNADNLSAWFKGGYQEWSAKQDKHFKKIERTREWASVSMKLAEANGGNLSEGAASILGGSILEMLEQVEDLKEAMRDKPPTPEEVTAAAEALESLSTSVARIRRGDHDLAIIRQNDKKLAQKDQDIALAEMRFQRDTCELFIKYAQDQKALDIAAAPLSNDAKINEMGKVLFGDLWQKAKPAA